MPEQSAIVNFASVDGLAVSPGQLLYCASKAAVIMLTRSIALDWHHVASGSMPSHPAGSTLPRTVPPAACRPPRKASRWAG